MTNTPLRDSKSDLLHAAQAAVKDRINKAAELVVTTNSPLRRRRTRMGVLVIIGVVGLVLMMLRPTWLVGPTTVPPDPPLVAAAGLRVEMIRQRQLVFNYARAHGRLPLSLEEAGGSLTGVRYRHQGDSGFTLTGLAGDSVMVLQSSDSQAVFLGNSLKILKNRGGQ